MGIELDYLTVGTPLSCLLVGTIEVRMLFCRPVEQAPVVTAACRGLPFRVVI